MGEPRSGPCEPWATVADVCSPCDDYDFDAGLLADSLDVASGLLYMWSGQQFPGVCADTVRPCTQRTRHAAWARYTGDQDGSTWRVVCGCGAADRCGCGSLSQIHLSSWPLVEVTQVKVDGVVLDPARYRVDDYRYLVRLADADGTNPGWPCCQDLSKASTEDGTFEVTFDHGRTAPAELGATRAAAVLGCELALACSPETASKCRLPKKTQQVVRAGVTINLIDPAALFARPTSGGPPATGLPEVQAFLSAVNPYGATAPSAIASPDVGAYSRRVGT